MEKDWFDKYSKELHCADCNLLDNCIKNKEPLYRKCCEKHLRNRIAELEQKVKKTHKFLKVLTDMVFEKDLVAQINWSGANQEICCRYLKELGYVKIDEDNCYVKVYKTFGRNEDE